MKLKHVIFITAALTSAGKGEPITPGTPLNVNLRIHQGIEVLEFDSDATKYYQFQYSPDNVNWQIEGLAFKGTGGHISYAVSGRGADKAFYRLRDDVSPNQVTPSAPSRTWVNEGANRDATHIYTNTLPYEIGLFIAVGVSNGNYIGDDQASYISVQTRKDDSSSWIDVGYTATSTRFLQGRGAMNTVIPAGWQYRLGNSAAAIGDWVELK